jgi:hypothetical protein
MTHSLLPALLFAATALQLTAQDFSGTYTGTYNGDAVTLQLKTTGTNQYTGTVNDSHLTYDVAAAATGNTLKGTCTEKTQQLTLQLAGVLNGAQLSLKLSLLTAVIDFELTKTGAKASTTTPPAATPQPKAPAGTQQDPAVVGRWTRQSNYNSGGGQAGSMSSENSMIFYADGRLADGGSRVVTSGDGWGGSSSDQGKGVLPGVIWYTKDKQLYLQATENGKTETQLLGKYYIENNNMLITAQDGTKVLFYKG